MPPYTLGKSRVENLCNPPITTPFIKNLGNIELEKGVQNYAKSFFSFRLEQFPATISTGKATTRWT